MNFAESITAQKIATLLSDDERIRKQALTRARRLNLTDADVIAAFVNDAAQARSFSDPEPALQYAESLLRRAA